ncbi:hypothetical protein CXF85_10215 [Colwellia sp. 75C3]|uniref:hypothetical protein n=1 Tax=Colwellia sp. 75C3 TaxID=888425 RepID=UPI000C320456|nr:hypothetical protein [Colwellia sp. 75C3]PKG83863.1 hypothetical protein CXF85_10215 [Colwellia sp. 75C3]
MFFNKVDLSVSAQADDYLAYCINKRNQFSRYATAWKITMRGLLLLSIFMASFAALIPAIESWIDFRGYSQEISTMFAALAALSSAILGTLKCEENFLFNRKQRHDMEQIIVDLSDPDVELQDIRGKIKGIMNERGDRE